MAPLHREVVAGALPTGTWRRPISEAAVDRVTLVVPLARAIGNRPRSVPATPPRSFARVAPAQPPRGAASVAAGVERASASGLARMHASGLARGNFGRGDAATCGACCSVATQKGGLPQLAGDVSFATVSEPPGEREAWESPEARLSSLFQTPRAKVVALRLGTFAGQPRAVGDALVHSALPSCACRGMRCQRARERPRNAH